MRDRRTAGRLMTAVVAGLIFATPMATHAAADAAQSVSQPDPTEPDTTEPETTEPETTEPETTEPGAADPEIAEADSTTVAVASIVGLLALLAVASWWMVRRRDDDDATYPISSVTDEPLPGQDLW